MEGRALAARLHRLPSATVLGREVRVARGPRARLLGLALLGRERAGPGLLIPRCSSVHTFGMRFALDIVFLDPGGAAIRAYLRVGPGRVLSCRVASAVLEIPVETDRRLGGFVEDLVGEQGEVADPRLQRGGDAQQSRVTGVAYPSLQAADVRRVNPRAVGESLLAQPGLRSQALNCGTKRSVLG
jgi:uncharacterized membrane protein (UPF0127 family)